MFTWRLHFIFCNQTLEGSPTNIKFTLIWFTPDKVAGLIMSVLEMDGESFEGEEPVDDGSFILDDGCSWDLLAALSRLEEDFEVSCRGWELWVWLNLFLDSDSLSCFLFLFSLSWLPTRGEPSRFLTGNLSISLEESLLTGVLKSFSFKIYDN